jgi:shikimate dehydrogenase/3-dehydroquinate dehydratase type I
MKAARNICQVLADAESDVTRRALTHPEDGVDVFELRIDCLDDDHRRADLVRDLVGAAVLPVVATCRPKSEGGRFGETDARREELLQAALGAGAAWVDLEWTWIGRDPGLMERFPAGRVQLSHHHQGPWSSSLEDLFTAMLKTKAGAIKLVARAETFEQAMRLVQLTAHGVRAGRRTSCFALGAAARISRILATIEGAYFTYVTDSGAPPVSGMLGLEEAVRTYRLGELPYPVKLLGILGHPLDHSLSPVMHNRVIQKLGERYLYVPFESPDPEPIIDFVRSHGVRGLSVTIPHKVRVIPLLDALDPTAHDAGAVNTVVREGTRLVGHNTDLATARHILERWGVGPADTAVVVGAGGAARALIRALAERRVPTTVINRSLDAAKRLASEFGATAGDAARLDAAAFNLLLNATPPGEHLSRIPMPKAPGASVLDLAYRAGGTPFTARALAAGCRTVDGIEFLARQGARQYSLWTKRELKPDLYTRVLEESHSAVRGAAKGRPAARRSDAPPP